MELPVEDTMGIATTASQKTLSLPAEVLTLAKDLGVDAYLPGMAKVFQEVFWDADNMRATVEVDPEIADLRNILFTAEGTWSKEEARQRRQQWYDRTLVICPTTVICTFCLYVRQKSRIDESPLTTDH